MSNNGWSGIHEALDSLIENIEDSFGIIAVKISIEDSAIVATSSDNWKYIYDFEANKQQSYLFRE